MHYQKILTGKSSLEGTDTTRVTQFLNQQFGATRYQHPYLENLVVLDKRLWWVVPVIDNSGADFQQGIESLNYAVLEQIDKLGAGILIFRQFKDNRLGVYLIDDIDILEQNIRMGLVLSWDLIETHKLFSEVGILIGDEVIGFKKLRQLRTDSKNPYPRSIA